MATESIGELIPTAIPGYADAADIQAALRAYHYGSYAYSPANTSPGNLVSPSMAKTIYDIQQDIVDLENRPSSGGDVAVNVPVPGDFTPSGIPNGYIWVDQDGTIGGQPISATSVFTNSVPTSDLSTGVIWVDKDPTSITENPFIPQAVISAKGDILVGTANDTASVLNTASTNGYILAVNSATTSGLEWIANDTGDITEVTAGTGISGGGTSGTVTITNSMATEITASGDIIVGTGSGTFDNLPIGSTGQVLTADTTVSPYKVKWATPASGDIEGVTAGTGISGGGTSGTVTITNSMATAIDAKGDLVAGTGADTFARLAVGSNGTYLQANSATATGLQWASITTGGLTAISTQSLSGSSTITFSSIPGTYKHLLLTINNWDGDNSLYLRSNGNTANYFNSTFGVSSTEFFNSTNLGSTTAAQAQFNNVSSWIYEYAQGSTYGFKQCDTRAMICTSGGSYTALDVAGANMNGTGAITSLSIVSGAGLFTNGTATLYGVS